MIRYRKSVLTFKGKGGKKMNARQISPSGNVKKIRQIEKEVSNISEGKKQNMHGRMIF
jgi:hypothetical protein